MLLAMVWRRQDSRRVVVVAAGAIAGRARAAQHMLGNTSLWRVSCAPQSGADTCIGLAAALLVDVVIPAMMSIGGLRAILVGVVMTVMVVARVSDVVVVVVSCGCGVSCGSSAHGTATWCARTVGGSAAPTRAATQTLAHRMARAPAAVRTPAQRRTVFGVLLLAVCFPPRRLVWWDGRCRAVRTAWARVGLPSLSSSHARPRAAPHSLRLMPPHRDTHWRCGWVCVPRVLLDPPQPCLL